MKKLSIPALIVLGGVTFIGLGVLISKVFPAFLTNGHSLVGPALIVAVSAALFVLGIFLGYLYSDTVNSHRAKKETLERFNKALEFERTERKRLESELYNAKQLTVRLEDLLSKQAEDSSTGGKDSAAGRPDENYLLSEIEELTKRQAKLEVELMKRKERMVDLLTELSLAQTEAEQLKASFGPPRLSPLLEGASIKDVLEGIAALAGVHMALVADDYGLVVDSAGDGMPSDILAATSALVAHIGPKVRDILPMGEVATISLGDDKGLVLDTRYFELFGARCALAIARDKEHPYPGLAEQAANAIVARFSE